MKKVFLLFLLISCIMYGAEWRETRMVDDFGDETGEVRISTDIENGSFSNSATSNSKLDGFIQVGKSKTYGKYIRFGTYEYGYSRGVETDMEDVTVKMKNSSNELLTKNLSSMYAFDSTVSSKYNDATPIINFIKKSNGNIKVVIYGSYSTVQKFSFNANGFTKKLQKIK